MLRQSILSLAAVLVFCAAAQSQEAVEAYSKLVQADPGLVALWRMEGDLAPAKGDMDAQLKGGQPAFVAGPGGGKAVSLGNGQFIVVEKADALDLPQSSVELWFKLSAPAGSTKYNPCLIAKRSNAPTHGVTRFSIHVWSDYKHIGVWNGTGVCEFDPPEEALAPDRWYYLVVTSDGQRTKFFLDGVECPPLGSPVPFNFKQAKLPLVIAASDPKGAEQLPGVYDEVAVYSRVLGEADIVRRLEAMGMKDRREKLLAAASDKQERARKEEEERLARHAQRVSQMLAQPELMAKGQTRVYKGASLTGIFMPMGGVAAGPLQIDGKAMRPIWQIFNNYKAIQLADTFFAACVKAEGGQAVLRALQAEPAGPMAGFKELTFRGEYPFGWFDFPDDKLGVQLSMECCSILTPLNARDSAFPAAVFSLTAHNTSARSVEVTFLASQQNPVGNALKGPAAVDRKCEGYGQNANKVIRQDGRTFLHMTGKAGGGLSNGDLVLAVDNEKALAGASWENLQGLADDVSAGKLGGGESAGPSADGQTLNGALAVPLKLAPGQKATVRFVLAWHFPNIRQPWVGGQGTMYQTWWPDAMAVAGELCRRLDELTGLTRNYHDSLYASNLPVWLIDRCSSQVAILVSRTCFWSRDGYFGGWEGCNPGGGCCNGNCGHVWHYAQAHARLLPEIGRRMREEALRHQRADGALFFRQPATGIAADAQAGEILEAYREHLNTTDNQWLQANWPRIKKAMEFMIAAWDRDEDGMMSGPQHNTLDADSGGSSSWLCSLYAAALAASDKMGTVVGDNDAAGRFRRICEAAKKNQNEKLFNGEYYIQIPDPRPLRDYNTGCCIDQVLGQWWADQLDLGPIYPVDRVRSAMGALLKYNFRPDFKGLKQAPRKFVDDADAGMQMIQWPDGKRPPNHTMYADEAMTGFEYAAAATMIQAGMLREGLLVAKAVSDRYDGRIRTALSGGDCTSWGYSGNLFGDDECGKFYARAMSSWSLLLAAQGLIFDGPGGTIGFRPRWQSEDHCSFFTAAEGYGVFTQKRTGTAQSEKIELKHGKLTVRTLVFEVPADTRVSSVAVKAGGKDAASACRQNASRVTISLKAPVTLSEGEAIEVEIK